MSASSSTDYTVTSGPFKGLKALSGEVVRNFDDSGRDYSVWDTHSRTRHFLDTFSPADGWKVHVDQSYLGMTMEDVFSRDEHGNALQNPAWLFTASLLDKDNNLVGNSAVVQLINCPMSFETGQTRARGKLYQALGLPGSPSIEEDARLTGFAPRTAQAISTPKVVPVADVQPATDIATSLPPAVAVVESVPDARSEPAEPESGDVEEVLAQDETASAEVVVAAVPPVDAQANHADAPPSHSSDRDPGLSVVSVTPPPAQAASAKASAKLSGPIPGSLLRQITLKATRANVTVPTFSTLDQAQAFLATLVNPGRATQDLISGGE